MDKRNQLKKQQVVLSLIESLIHIRMRLCNSSDRSTIAKCLGEFLSSRRVSSVRLIPLVTRSLLALHLPGTKSHDIRSTWAGKVLAPSSDEIEELESVLILFLLARVLGHRTWTALYSSQLAGSPSDRYCA